MLAQLKRQYKAAKAQGFAIPVPKGQEKHTIMKALLEMLIMCNMSFGTVNSPWFRKFCWALRPGFKPQSRLCRQTANSTV